MSAPIQVAGLTLELGARPVLRGVELSVRPGEVLAVMGVSGSGKTSLLKCMAGLLRPTGGSIRIGNHDLVGMTESELNEQRTRMGMVFQYAALFDSLSVYENVVFGLRYQERRGKRVDEVTLRRIAGESLAAVGLAGSEDLLPSQLSGGMRKRVGLARALATNPQVVFYDEPTSGLDPIVARMIDDLIVHVRDSLGVTSVIVSHDVGSVLRCADRAALLHDGVIQFCEPPAVLRESRDPLARQFLDGAVTGPIEVTG